MNKRYNKMHPIKLKDLDEGCLLVDKRNHVWLVEDIIENRIILCNAWDRNHYTNTISIGRKGCLYGFYLY